MALSCGLVLFHRFSIQYFSLRSIHAIVLLLTASLESVVLLTIVHLDVLLKLEKDCLPLSALPQTVPP
jgi:hypothetical protein